MEQTVLVFCCFTVCFTQVDSSTVMRCSVNATFHFVEDQTPNITCSGFPVGYWSLTGPPTGGQELRIGDCSSCAPVGACSCKTNTTDYSITRNGDISTLFFVDNLSGNNRSTITCSREDNNTCVTSTINIIKAPVLCQHANNCIEIVEDQPTPITCQGAQDKDIYWSVTRPSTPENRIGNCSKCATKSHLPCTCHTHNGDYSITRTGDKTTAVSILQFVNNVATNDNSTIKCSAPEDNQPLVSVSIKVIPAYRLPACNNSKVALYENSNRRIRCEGMELSQDMYWSITYPNMTEHTVAECGNCENEMCPQCDVKIDDFSVERNQTFSVLRMTAGNDRDKEGAIVKCSKLNNATNHQCQLSIRYPGAPENSSLVVDSNFTVTGRVQVNKVYEPDGSVACLWYHSPDNVSIEDVPTSAIHLNLFSFTDDNGLEYLRGTCTMTMQLNASEMTHYFHVEIQPGGGRTFADTVTIVKPGPNLTTTCPDYVTEGSDLTCECSHCTAQHGNPPATISWRDVTGTAVLHLPSVHRNLNGTEFVCTSVWGEETPDGVLSSENYTLLVAYDEPEPEPFPWVVVAVVVGATVLVIIIVIAIVVVVYRRRGNIVMT
ncbi:uncharacterized protein [Littorina saxatilis]|uniref:uncharacterized protein n=1 Tax=Littorina saxatilis TaxID=31220 RepID=UPI0038B4D819